MTRRVLDLVLALAGVVVVTPILRVIGIFIAVEDEAPVFCIPLHVKHLQGSGSEPCKAPYQNRQNGGRKAWPDNIIQRNVK